MIRRLKQFPSCRFGVNLAFSVIESKTRNGLALSADSLSSSSRRSVARCQPTHQDDRPIGVDMVLVQQAIHVESDQRTAERSTQDGRYRKVDLGSGRDTQPAVELRIGRSEILDAAGDPLQERAVARIGLLISFTSSCTTSKWPPLKPTVASMSMPVGISMVPEASTILALVSILSLASLRVQNPGTILIGSFDAEFPFGLHAGFGNLDVVRAGKVRLHVKQWRNLDQALNAEQLGGLLVLDRHLLGIELEDPAQVEENSGKVIFAPVRSSSSSFRINLFGGSIAISHFAQQLGQFDHAREFDFRFPIVGISRFAIGDEVQSPHVNFRAQEFEVGTCGSAQFGGREFSIFKFEIDIADHRTVRRLQFRFPFRNLAFRLVHDQRCWRRQI